MLYVSDDWHKINGDDIDSYSSLLDFHSSLIFCNAVVQVTDITVLIKIKFQILYFKTILEQKISYIMYGVYYVFSYLVNGIFLGCS